MLVTNYRPLKAYQYVHGFARFCNAKYNTDMGDMDNPFIHLTNVAIQKHNQDYNSKHGGKWHIKVGVRHEARAPARSKQRRVMC